MDGWSGPHARTKANISLPTQPGTASTTGAIAHHNQNQSVAATGNAPKIAASATMATFETKMINTNAGILPSERSANIDRMKNA